MKGFKYYAAKPIEPFKRTKHFVTKPTERL